MTIQIDKSFICILISLLAAIASTFDLSLKELLNLCTCFLFIYLLFPQVGYTGPIYMTHPTKAIAPILLEDMRKVAVERKGESNFFTSQMIKDCMKKVVAVTLHQSVMVDPELEIKAYYAGHVLGAAMFWVRVGSQSIVYTGDYNMTPDRHLGAAWIDKCRPDLLISESTYATTIRDSKRCRERDFLKKVCLFWLIIYIKHDLTDRLTYIILT